MTQEQFDQIVENRIKIIKDTLRSKGEEYAQGTDRLQAFKDAAILRNTTNEDALGGMVAKHLVSINSMIKVTSDSLFMLIQINANNEHKYSYEVWNEKIQDVINYMILLDAIIQEHTL